jgi:AcrR family transcriptional regulator
MENDPVNKARSAYACSTDTHERIVSAAIALFGERGFEAASTREIANRGGVLAPLINYHFKSKEGLYRACATEIHAFARASFDRRMDDINQAVESNASPDVLMKLFESLVEFSLGFLLANKKASQIRLFIMQDQAGNGPGGIPDETLLQYRLAQMRNFTKLIAALCGMNEEDPDVRIRSLCLQGQMNIFYTFPLPTLKVLELEQFDEIQLKKISRIVIANIHILMRAWRSEANGYPAPQARAPSLA